MNDDCDIDLSESNDARRVMTATPPATIRHGALTLELYDASPVRINGQEWFTYHVSDKDERLWEFCPESGRVIRTK